VVGEREPGRRTRRPATSVPIGVARRLRADMTPHEVRVWNWIRDGFHPVGWKFRRQVPIGRHVVDFASLRPKVVIEIDGDQHATDAAMAADRMRDAELAALGFTVLRFSNREVEAGETAFLDALAAELARIGPPPVRARSNEDHIDVTPDGQTP